MYGTDTCVFGPVLEISVLIGLRTMKAQNEPAQTAVVPEPSLLAHTMFRPEVIKLFPCSTQLSTKSILLINVKTPTIVGVLTFVSMINTTSERLISKKLLHLSV